MQVENPRNLALPKGESPGALAPYRVLDLAQGGSALASRILADMGADVIKVEPPGGEPGRRLPPFYQGIPGPERSLFWFSCNLNKRAITLDLASDDGMAALRKLAVDADFLFESFSPGYLDRLGLGYEDLRAINPRLIMVSITPFGQSGPYAHLQGPDIVPWAMSGYMWMCGDPDRAPVRPSVPGQADFHAAGIAAGGALIALAGRTQSGHGYHVDQSAQACGPWMMMHGYQWYEFGGRILKREGGWRQFGLNRGRTLFPCKDGYVVVMLFGGQLGGPAINRLFEWMGEDGVAPDSLKGMDWTTYNAHSPNQALTNALEDACTAFFLTKTKLELLEGAIKRGLQLAPAGTIKDVVEDTHLAARGFWVDVEHPELDGKLRYPGAPFIATETPWRVYRRPPLIGEHNGEVLGGTPKAAGAGDAMLSKRRVKQAEARLEPLPRPAGASANDGGRRPLEGLKIVDLSGVVMGPTVTRLMADYGATVIKIESSLRPDSLRTMTPYKDGIEGLDRSGYFGLFNAGKLSLTLNLKKPKAVEILGERLIPWADILIEAFMPGVMEGWGLDYEAVRKIKPDIIYLRASLMGHSGPRMYLKGTGQVTAALAGWYDLTGWPDGLPVGPYSAYSDFISWNYALAAVLAAADHRRRTGKGQYIDQALLESTIQFAAPAALDYTVNGVMETRQGNRDPVFAPHGAYRCLGDDRWCVIAVTSDDQWAGFRKAIGSPEWTRSPSFATLPGRKQHEDELDRLVEEWTSRHDAREVMALLQGMGVPAGVVQDARDILNDPQLKHREGFVIRDHPVMGPHSVYTSSFRISGVDHAPWRAAPMLGQDNEHICRDLLGISEEELADWIGAEVLE